MFGVEKQILLGSITRLELQRVLDENLSRERRVHYFNSIKVLYANQPSVETPSINYADDEAEIEREVGEPFGLNSTTMYIQTSVIRIVQLARHNLMFPNRRLFCDLKKL